MLGKRKREAIVARRSDARIESAPSTELVNQTINDVFRQYFESTFDPLSRQYVSTSTIKEDETSSLDSDAEDGDQGNDDTGSDWSGIPDEVAQPIVVEVVNYAAASNKVDTDPINKIFQKSFMGSKPPREALLTSQTTETSKPPDTNDVEETKNLKHDLDLQRLLKESHLLEQTKLKSDGGVQRHKATDMRLQSLGSRASLFSQGKMPMSHRKGIMSKALSKDAQRRKEAKENGVILEKTSKKSTASGPRRDRGVDVPIVGKFKGGTLQLSRKDVASIQGPRRGGSKRGRR